MPSFSIISAGKTREAKALLKMSENSLSRPPMPISLKSQFGLMRGRLAESVLFFPDSLIPEPYAYSKEMMTNTENYKETKN